MRATTGLAVLLGALAFLVASAGATHQDAPVLTGDVGSNDSFSLSLKDAAGAPVSHLDPGTYTLLVHDHSTFHNFHLSGPGVDVATGVDGVGDSTFTVTLADGMYFFQCDPHSAQMHGKFAVGSATVTTTPSPAPPSVLAGSLTARRVSLAPTAGLTAGRFAITVADRSTTDGFRLSGRGLSRATGIAFRGTLTWHVTLAAGRYTYGSLRHTKLRGSFVVSP